MTLSTTALALTTAPACDTYAWCIDHAPTGYGHVHASRLRASAMGLVSGLRAFSDPDGAPLGNPTVLLYSPLEGVEVEPWRLDALQELSLLCA